MQIRHYRCSQK